VWKWLLGLVLCIFLLAGGSIVYLQSSGKLQEVINQFRPDSAGVRVRIGKAHKGDLVRTVSAPGTIEPKTRVEISAQVSARIIALPFREGERVKKDDVVVRLDARDLAAIVDSAKAQLKSEEARLDGTRASYLNAQLEFNRRKELFATKDIPKTELDLAEADFLRAQSTFRSQEHAIEIAQANILRAEKDLDNAVITSPFDGIITRLDAEVGETVVVGTLNNPGSVIMEIADLTKMLLKTRIDEANIAPVSQGQKAKVFVNAFPDQVFIGVIDHVGLKKRRDTDGTTYFETDILLELPENVMLRDGMTANAEIQVETFRDVVKVPSQAVIDYALDELPISITENNPRVDRSRKFIRVVFTVSNNKTVAVPVLIGPSDLTDTVITEGLNPDDVIITGPFKALVKLKNGEQVRDEALDPKKPAEHAGTASDQKKG
jgi:HlyD family secretion protein